MILDLLASWSPLMRNHLHRQQERKRCPGQANCWTARPEQHLRSYSKASINGSVVTLNRMIPNLQRLGLDFPAVYGS